jgi:hypothetical protein
MPDFLFWNEVVIPLAGMATVLLISLSVVKAVARHLERRHESGVTAGAAAGGPELDRLRSEVGLLRTQVESLEERVDFAERLLTQERNRKQLEGEGRKA